MKICFFGDSICVGQGISLEKTWSVKISKLLNENSDKRSEYLIANSSVNGRTSREALLDMPYHVQSQSFDVLIIQFGMNDCNYWETDNGLPRVSKSSFESNLKEIISRGFHFGAKKIFLNTNHQTTRLNNFKFIDLSYQKSNSDYNKIIRKVAVQENVILVDIENEILKYSKEDNFKLKDIVLDDKLHLSQLGHELYFKIIKKKLFRHEI